LKENVAEFTARPRRATRLKFLIGFTVAASFPFYAAIAGPLDLDTTFSNDGKVVTNFQLDPQDARDIGRDIAVQQDGKIIAVGAALNGNQSYDFALVQYKPTGSIDQGIQIPGLVHTDFDSTDDEAYAVAIQPDGKIVVAGYVQNQSGEFNSHDLALARYNSDLTLDEGFGKKGLVRTDLEAYEVAYAMALQPDGKIVVVGQREPNGAESDFLIARYLPTGELDKDEFGDGGKVITDFGAWDIAWAVEIQNDGKIVVVGSSWGPNFQPVHGALARYNPHGDLDQSFTHGLGPFICLYVETCGKTKVSFGGGYPVALALRKADGTQDGKIVVAGKFGLARFNADGTFDDTFGNAGIVDSQNNLAYAVAIEANGDVVAAGTDLDDFVVEIYKPNGKRCSATNTDFKGDIDEALATTIQPDGMILVLGHASLGPPSDFALARYVGGNCTLRLSKNFLAYHVYVPPYELVGPPIPPIGPHLAMFRSIELNGLEIGSSEQVALPATEGGAFSDKVKPGYQAFKLINSERKNLPPQTLVNATNSLGGFLFEVLEPQQLLVPTDFATRAGGMTASGSRSEALLKCYHVKMTGDKGQREKKPVTVSDALTRSWTFEVGEPALLCKPIDGGETKGRMVGLVGYQITGLKEADTTLPPVRLPAVNAFGGHILQVERPELLFLLSLVE